MANSTFSGPVRSEGGFNVINKAAATGVVTETRFFCKLYWPTSFYGN